MEKDKYYTPSIEEFHVGFEYEAKERFGDGTVKTQEDFDNVEWIKKSMNDGELPYIERMLNGRNAANGLCGIRVKFIDREDIESFGFTESHFSNIDTSFFKLKDYTLYIDFNTRRMNFSESEHNLNLMLFQGFIKNKSELSRLLKQLSII